MGNDIYWMKRALAISQRGLGLVNPNPMVGAIVIDDQGYKIADGYHAAYGKDHAEKIALDRAGIRAQGGTLYVTLEPCSHHGKTPPCLEAVIKSGVKRVVIGSLDPNPNVSSVSILQEHQIEVTSGVLAAEIAQLNRIFFARMQNQSYVLAKLAISRDGYMGHAKKQISISGPQVQRHTMKLRAMVDGILVGSHTWKTDDPGLNVRGKYSDRAPACILLDARLEIHQEAKVFAKAKGQVILIYDPMLASPQNWMVEQGITCLGVTRQKNGFRPADILMSLRQQGIYAVLLEGGGQIIRSFSEDRCIDDWVIYHSPTPIAQDYPISALILAPQMPFSPDLQSAIRCGQDWMWTTLSLHNQK